MRAADGARAGGRAGRRALAVARCLCCALLAALAAGQVEAHNLGDSYLYLQVYEDSVSGRFEIALSDLNPALGLSGTEREITAENLDERIGFLQDYYREHVTISADAGPLPIEFRQHGLSAARGGFVLLPFDLGGLDGVPDVLTFDYSVLLEEDPDHRGFLLVEHNWATGTFANENRISLVFGPGSTRQRFDLTSSGRLRGFLAVVRLGAEHMLLGLDHVFFLIALLLPAVLRREDGGWRAVDGVAPALRKVVTIVTALLVAHGVALVLTALGVFRLPERLVETAIAASIAIAAADVFWPVFRRGLWWIVCGLGLFHGLGFAAALSGLGLLEEHLGLSLVAFVLGVEIGQLAIVAVVVPLLFLGRRLTLYRKVALPAAAVGLILVAGVWVTERALGVDVPMRELLPPAVQKVIP